MCDQAGNLGTTNGLEELNRRVPLDTEKTVWEPGMFFSRANMTVGKSWLAVVEIRRASEGERQGASLRSAPGVRPKCFLIALLNDESEEYPVASAITAMGWRVFCNVIFARKSRV